jgi:Zn-dependent membrane protease YugP
MPLFGFGFDPTFVILIPALIFSMWAQWKVQHTYQKYSQVRASLGRTGREMAQAILTRNGISGVPVEETQGFLADHYDPRTRSVHLSPHNYRTGSIAAIAVAAHEVGHAMQHAQGYVPLAFRSSLFPVVSIGSWLAMPLFFIGFLIGQAGGFLMDLGILFFVGVVLFQAVTLPVEFDASRRALVQLTKSGAIATEEVGMAKKVLDAAALTYVAAAAMAALQLLRLVMLRNSRD